MNNRDLKPLVSILIEAAEWRDECLDAKEWASWMKAIYREDYLLRKRWDRSLCHATKLFNEADKIYKSILRIVKEAMI